MTDQAYSIIVRNGSVVLPQGVARLDVGIRDETIVAIGENLAPGIMEIDATDKIVALAALIRMPTSNRYLEAGCLMPTLSRAQPRQRCLGAPRRSYLCRATRRARTHHVVADYHDLACRGAVIDYAFHMILADPNDATLKTHLPKLVQEGHASIKVFMTYDRIKLDDEQLLDVLAAARDNGAFVCVHAENHGMISFMSKRLLANGLTAPSAFWMSHPRLARSTPFSGWWRCRSLSTSQLWSFTSPPPRASKSCARRA